jgi:2-dehydro-3-deoxygluconokinase
MGLTISCDLNYRAKLWNWTKTSGKVMENLVKYCDIAIGNEEDAEKVFGIQAPETDISSGKVDAKQYLAVCEALAKKIPNLKKLPLPCAVRSPLAIILGRVSFGVKVSF